MAGASSMGMTIVRRRREELRDAGIMPLICPTCQNVLAGQSIHADALATLHGVVFDVLVWGEKRVGVAVGKRGLPGRSSRAAARLRPLGFGFQSVFTFASLKLRRTPRFALQAPRGRATR